MWCWRTGAEPFAGRNSIATIPVHRSLRRFSGYPNQKCVDDLSCRTHSTRRSRAIILHVFRSNSPGRLGSQAGRQLRRIQGAPVSGLRVQTPRLLDRVATVPRYFTRFGGAADSGHLHGNCRWDGRCKKLSVISSPTALSQPLRGRWSNGERSEPSATDPAGVGNRKLVVVGGPRGACVGVFDKKHPSQAHPWPTQKTLTS